MYTYLSSPLHPLNVKAILSKVQGDISIHNPKYESLSDLRFLYKYQVLDYLLIRFHVSLIAVPLWMGL